jgi:hypothetical protein
MEQDDENQIPIFRVEVCQKFFEQLAQAAFGHILERLICSLGNLSV